MTQTDSGANEAGEARAAGPARSFLLPGLAVSAAVLLLDQLSKWLITAYVAAPHCVTPPVSQAGCTESVLPFFNLTLVYNPGVTFGLGGDLGPWVLSALAIAIGIGLIAWLRTVDTLLLALAVGGIIGGAFGNAADRLWYGAVVDFLDFFIGKYHWPAFNVADSAIVVGVGIILFDSIIAGRGKTA